MRFGASSACGLAGWLGSAGCRIRPEREDGAMGMWIRLLAAAWVAAIASGVVLLVSGAVVAPWRDTRAPRMEGGSASICWASCRTEGV